MESFLLLNTITPGDINSQLKGSRPALVVHRLSNNNNNISLMRQQQQKKKPCKFTTTGNAAMHDDVQSQREAQK